MALENCPECKKQISSTVTSCPHCGYSPKKSSNSGSLVLYIILTVIGIVVLYGVFISGNSKPEIFISSQTTAYRYASKKVKEKLKSPSTAEFPKYADRINHVKGYGNEYTISSWVDSQNSFGATIRTKFSCKVVYEGDYVRIIELKFEN